MTSDVKHSTIALLTDFGTEDGYAGAMKGAILNENPNVKIVDISHDIQPFDIRQAAFCLNNSYPYFPEKTVFVVVIDPGVGTKRRGIVVKTSQHQFIGPDNGVFSFVFQREGYQAYEIQLSAFEDDISTTFHGRDVFAKVAAWLASGKPLTNYLQPIREARTFAKPPIKVKAGEYLLKVMHHDHFGNLILNLHRQDWIIMESPQTFCIRSGNHEWRRLVRTYGDMPVGEIALLWDSSGYMQIAQNQGNAAKTLKLKVSEPLQLTI